LRTLWEINGLAEVARLFSSALALKIVILVLEAWEKGSLLRSPYRDATPEARSGLYNRSVFWWLNHFLAVGFGKVISFEDLYPLDDALSSEHLAEFAQSSWQKSTKSDQYALLWSTLVCLKWPLLAPAIPRLAMIGFNYSQPFLITRIINYVQNEERDKNIGYGLIGAAAIIYIGIAISNGRYQHANFRFMIMIRGSLSSLIYQQTLDLQYTALEDASPVSFFNDVDYIVTTSETLHEIWAATVEVIIAMYLLGQGSGVGCIAPVVLAMIGASANAFWVGPQMKKHRPRWNAAIQKRVALTASLLKDMKALKMLGLTNRMQALLQDQRRSELDKSINVRTCTIWLNIFGNLMGIFAKAFVLMTVALQAQNGGQALTAAKAYGLISLINLVDRPLSIVTADIPGFMGALGCFERIQNYLLAETRSDNRITDSRITPGPSPVSSAIELRAMPAKSTTSFGDAPITFDECSFGYSSNTSVLKDLSSTIRSGTVTMIVGPVGSADHIIALREDGAVVEQGTFNNLVANQGYIKRLAIEARDQLSHEDPRERTQESDGIVAEPVSSDDIAPNDRRLGDFCIYKYYGKRVGAMLFTAFLACEFIKVSLFSLPDLWVQFWAEDQGAHMDMYISVMFVISICNLLFNYISLWVLLIKIIPRSGLRLHWTLLTTITAAPLSYFAKTDAGIILNRFSQDMTIIDTSLPIALLQLSATVSEIIWQGALICYGAYYLVAFIPFIGAVLYAIQKFYLRTSRQLRLLDLEMKSPLFTHFSETQEGLVTIRAFQWQSSFYNSFLQKLDASQKPVYLLYMIQQWLGLTLALVVAAIAIALVAFATQFSHQTSGGQIGVALISVMGFSSSLAELISHWTTLETSIGAVARLKQLELEVQPEDLPSENDTPPSSWPQAGAVAFESISAGYGPEKPLVLRDVSLSVRAGEKIGICGRTGSGKSTLIAVLFRLLPTRTGTVTIDNLNLSTIPRQKIRSSIIAIPQEPYILSGTVRFNAAPHCAPFSELDTETSSNVISDDAIIAALETVQLWSIIARRGGLSTPIKDLGLSQGQKQLFCLARAMLRKSEAKIMILDEATSSVDKLTDELMAKIIETEFRDHTVISVAHRLSSLVGCDRVVVMDEGRIVEIGEPGVLMGVEDGWWRKLWEAQD
ncbi:putative multidrug resistance protein, partial [Aureobasidium subglaciale]